MNQRNITPLLNSSSYSYIMSSMNPMEEKKFTQIKPRDRLLSEFQDVLLKADAITSKYSKLPSLFDKSLNTTSTYQSPYTLPIPSNNFPFPSNKPHKNIQTDIDISLSDDIEDSFNADAIANEIENYESEPKSQESKLEQEINQLKQMNQLLSRSNFELKNNNKILEVELSTYKNASIYPSNAPLTYYDTNLAQFTSSVKNSLIESINSNLNLVQLIISLQEENKTLFENNLNLTSSIKGTLGELRNANRKNAEIYINNAQNALAIDEIEEKNKNLHIELEHRQLELNDLIGKENNLNLIKASNEQKKKDINELIKQYTLTMENLSKTSSVNMNILNKNQKDIVQIEGEINNKKQEINAMMMSLGQLKEEHEEIKKKNKVTLRQVEENEKKLEKLKMEVFEVDKEVDSEKKENERVKRMFEEKEKIIELLKENISNVMKGINKENKGKEMSEEEAQNEIKKLDEEIKEAIGEIENKDKEIEDINGYYKRIMQNRENNNIEEMMVQQDKDDVPINYIPQNEDEIISGENEQKEDHLISINELEYD